VITAVWQFLEAFLFAAAPLLCMLRALQEKGGTA
jgi:hypothetical protein